MKVIYRTYTLVQHMFLCCGDASDDIKSLTIGNSFMEINVIMGKVNGLTMEDIPSKNWYFTCC